MSQTCFGVWNIIPKAKKEKYTWKYYEYGQTDHTARNYKTKQKMKKQSLQENLKTDIKEKDKQKGSGEDSEQIQYKGPMYLKSKINILFHIKGITKKKSSTCKQTLNQRMAKNYRQKYWWILNTLTQKSMNNWLKTRKYKPD